MAKERKGQHHEKAHRQEKETGGPEHKGSADPQPEATHGGNVEDFGEQVRGERPGAEKIRANQHAMGPAATRRGGQDPTGQNRERLRTEGELGGKQDKESSYQGGQGKKLPPPKGEDEPD